MFKRGMRPFAVLASLLLVSPLAVGLLPSGQDGRSLSEGRTLSSWPAMPRNARGWRDLPKAVDAFVADHFGLRDAMTHLQSIIAYRWLGEANPDVLVGRDGRLFYYGDQAVAQSAGLLMRTDAVRDTIEVVSDMRAALAARGIRLVVASPPNAASIYGDDLPAWARRDGRTTEPERVLDGLRARGLTVVDLRGILEAARDRGNLYHRTDTHWTPLGTTIAYDAIATAAGHPDWAVRPADVIGRQVSVSGDLARMLGLAGDLSETYPDWTLPTPDIASAGPPEAALQVATGVAGGPAVLVLGDSFTEISFASLMAPHAGRIGWLHGQNCGFDWSWIDRFEPDEVWWVPTERLMLCNPGTRPKGMPLPRRSALP